MWLKQPVIVAVVDVVPLYEQLRGPAIAERVVNMTMMLMARGTTWMLR